MPSRARRARRRHRGRTHALTIINYLNLHGPSILPPTFTGTDYLDVNGDDDVSPLDALIVINYLNDVLSSAGGQSVVANTATAVGSETTKTPVAAAPVDASLAMGVSLSSGARPAILGGNTLASIAIVGPQVGSTAAVTIASDGMDRAAVDSLLTADRRRQPEPANQPAAVDAVLADSRLEWWA